MPSQPFSGVLVPVLTPFTPSGEPDAGRIVHGLEHVVGELAYLRRDLFDRPGDQPQLFVWQDNNFTNGHGGRFNLLVWRGQCIGSAGLTRS